MREKSAQEAHTLHLCRSEDEGLKMAKRIAAGESPTPIEGNKEQIVLAANALRGFSQHQRNHPSPFEFFHTQNQIFVPGSRENVKRRWDL
jgi:hypothetical protein